MQQESSSSSLTVRRQPQHPASVTKSWIATLDREPTTEELMECMSWLDKDEAAAVRRFHRREDAWRFLVSKLLPILILKSMRIRRPNWAYRTTKGGKVYIDVVEHGKMGVSVCAVDRLSGITYSVGKHKVVNTGIDAMRMQPPTGVSIPSFVESLMHKLAPLELSFLPPKLPEDVLLRRLCILLTLKEAYVKALGQPAGFDFSRIEFDFPNNRLKVDDNVINGWEFKLFRVNLPVKVVVPPTVPTPTHGPIPGPSRINSNPPVSGPNRSNSNPAISGPSRSGSVAGRPSLDGGRMSLDGRMDSGSIPVQRSMSSNGYGPMSGHASTMGGGANGHSMTGVGSGHAMPGHASTMGSRPPSTRPSSSMAVASSSKVQLPPSHHTLGGHPHAHGHSHSMSMSMHSIHAPPHSMHPQSSVVYPSSSSSIHAPPASSSSSLLPHHSHSSSTSMLPPSSSSLVNPPPPLPPLSSNPHSIATMPPPGTVLLDSDGRQYTLQDDWYQCVNAVYRGYDDRSTFFHCDKEGDLSGEWLHFWNVESILGLVRGTKEAMAQLQQQNQIQARG